MSSRRKGLLQAWWMSLSLVILGFATLDAQDKQPPQKQPPQVRPPQKAPVLPNKVPPQPNDEFRDTRSAPPLVDPFDRKR